MNDPHAGELNTLTTPGINSAAISPSDSTDLPTIPRALYVGTGGHINVTLAGDTAPIVLKNVPSGAMLPIRVKRVYSASTTATDIVAIW